MTSISFAETTWSKQNPLWAESEKKEGGREGWWKVGGRDAWKAKMRVKGMERAIGANHDRGLNDRRSRDCMRWTIIGDLARKVLMQLVVTPSRRTM